MKEEYLEAYEFYKRQYPSSIILFHIGNGYYAFEDDAFVVAETDGFSVLYSHEEQYHWYDFCQDELEAVCDKLRNIAQKPVTVVEYRNSLGSFDIPKVKQILQDIWDDY